MEGREDPAPGVQGLIMSHEHFDPVIGGQAIDKVQATLAVIKVL